MKRLQEKEKYGTLTICSSDSDMLAYNVVGIWYLFLLSLIHTKKHRSSQKQTMMPSLIVLIMIQSIPWTGVDVPLFLPNYPGLILSSLECWLFWPRPDCHNKFRGPCDLRFRCHWGNHCLENTDLTKLKRNQGMSLTPGSSFSFILGKVELSGQDWEDWNMVTAKRPLSSKSWSMQVVGLSGLHCRHV